MRESSLGNLARNLHSSGMEVTMSNSEPTSAKGRDMLDALKAAKENARLQLHLFTLDARKRWNDLEGKLEGLEHQLYRAEAGADVLVDEIAGRVNELTGAVRDLVRDAMSRSTDLNAPVSSLLKGPAYTCSPTDSLSQAAKLLWEYDCGALVVTDDKGAVVGMITDRDVCMAAYTQGTPLHALSVKDTMSSHVHYLRTDATLMQAATLLAQHRIRRAPVLDHEQLVGVLALADLALSVQDAASGGLPRALLVTRTLASISEPRPGHRQARAAE
jgi:CBS domain-containing protein